MSAMKSNGGSPWAPRQQLERSAHVSVTIESPNNEDHSNGKHCSRPENKKLARSIRKKLRNLPSQSSKCCIFRVPEKLRQGYEVAYMPRVIAIGPYHHNDPGLKRMEDHKLRYLQSFLRHNMNIRLEDCFERIRCWEDHIRSCYDGPIELDSDEFAEMTLLDGFFVIQLFLMFQNPRWRLDGDRIFGKPRILDEVRRDMTLLENQMPFFAIERLFEMAYGSHQKHLSGLLELAYGFFRPSTNIEELPEAVMESEVQHFLDAIRLLYLPTARKPPSESEDEIKFIPSATELVAAGVKLKRGTSQRLFDIKFKKGKLEIPRLKFYYSTESCFRNIIAFEQCYYQNDRYLIDYMTFMDHLVNTPDDAKLLINKGIIENWLGNENAAADLINTLCKETFQRSSNTYFSSLRGELDAHCRKPHNKWKATFKRNYCSSPWAVLSIIAAVVLLTLTIVQTVCSLLSLK
ncbi:UPF0481 protein At3g47200-like [Rhodamnia argentea]|uniref:UPF0481 protein At3g47200-like n=1 Tax=Rhodamnia argentea TaxID=178133 RepID=A0ABM3HAG7_9MYRT|nr:UPF0481 protein At3g47200-like [Rhodamnia argentea]